MFHDLSSRHPTCGTPAEDSCDQKLVLNVFFFSHEHSQVRAHTYEGSDSPVRQLPETAFVYNNPPEIPYRWLRLHNTTASSDFGVVFKVVHFDNNRLTVSTMTAWQWHASFDASRAIDHRAFFNLVDPTTSACIDSEWSNFYALMVDDHWLRPGDAQNLHFTISSQRRYSLFVFRGSRRRYGRYFRRIRTTRTLRLGQPLDDHDSRYPLRASQRKLPSAWDDLPISSLNDRSWKNHRKTQYKAQ